MKTKRRKQRTTILAFILLFVLLLYIIFIWIVFPKKYKETIESATKRAAVDFLNELKIIHSKEYKDTDIIVLGPVTPRVSKLGGKYRDRIIIKCKNTSDFRKMISELLKQFEKDKKYDKVSIYADINPENIL